MGRKGENGLVRGYGDEGRYIIEDIGGRGVYICDGVQYGQRDRCGEGMGYRVDNDFDYKIDKQIVSKSGVFEEIVIIADVVKNNNNYKTIHSFNSLQTT